jgi:hypothetical protein
MSTTGKVISVKAVARLLSVEPARVRAWHQAGVLRAAGNGESRGYGPRFSANVVLGAIRPRIVAPDRLMTLQEAATALQVCLRLIFGLIAHDTLTPYFLPDGEVRLLRSNVRQWRVHFEGDLCEPCSLRRDGVASEVPIAACALAHANSPMGVRLGLTHTTSCILERLDG